MLYLQYSYHVDNTQIYALSNVMQNFLPLSTDLFGKMVVWCNPIEDPICYNIVFIGQLRARLKWYMGI